MGTDSERWQFAADGHEYIVFVSVRRQHYTGGWVKRVHPRKKTVSALDAYGRRHEVPLDSVLQVWKKPPRARKASKVWDKSKERDA